MATAEHQQKIQACERKLALAPALRLLAAGAGGIALAHALPWPDLPIVGITNQIAIAGLIFLVGLAILGFLVFLTVQSLALLRNPTIPTDRLALIKDLPLGLPEGTVRATLALIVGVIGLPLLLFMAPLGIPEATAALVANIITGVFAFYFGQRASGPPDPANHRALSGVLESTTREREALMRQANDLRQAADAALPTARDTERDRLTRYADLADTLLTVLGPALPKGMLPEGLGTAITAARRVAAAAQDLSRDNPDTLTELRAATSRLLGQTGLSGLITKASQALGPVSGLLPPAAAIALLLSVGWRVGAAQYRSWRARLLNAPWDPALIDPGLITATTVETCLAQVPALDAAFAAARGQPGFHVSLLNEVLADDAVERLWARFGHDGALFADPAALRRAVAQFRLLLLGQQSVADAGPAPLAAATAALAEAANPSLRAATAPEHTHLDAIPIRPDAPEDAQAALHALVMLVGEARMQGIDLPRMLSELP